jgi:hypothetical protein
MGLNERYKKMKKAEKEEKTAMELVFSLKAALLKAAPEARPEIRERLKAAGTILGGAMVKSTEAWRSYSALPGER